MLRLRLQKLEAFLNHLQTFLTTSAFNPVTSPNRMMDVPFVVHLAVLKRAPYWDFCYRFPGCRIIGTGRLMRRPVPLALVRCSTSLALLARHRGVHAAIPG